MPSDGGPAAQLTRDKSNDMVPSWSPDGRELAFHSSRVDITNVFVVPAAGADARQVTYSREAAFTPQWSPDGAWIAYVSRRRLWRVPVTGGTEQKLGEKCETGSYHWTRNGFIYCSRAAGDEPREVWALTPASGAERRVARLSGRAGSFGPGLRVESEHLYFTWSSDLGDIWVADVLGEPY